MYIVICWKILIFHEENLYLEWQCRYIYVLALVSLLDKISIAIMEI